MFDGNDANGGLILYSSVIGVCVRDRLGELGSKELLLMSIRFFFTSLVLCDLCFGSVRFLKK